MAELELEYGSPGPSPVLGHYPTCHHRETVGSQGPLGLRNLFLLPVAIPSSSTY